MDNDNGLYLITYTIDDTWDTVDTMVVEAECKDDVEEQIVQLLESYGVESDNAEYVAREEMYFVKECLPEGRASANL